MSQHLPPSRNLFSLELYYLSANASNLLLISFYSITCFNTHWKWTIIRVSQPCFQCCCSDHVLVHRQSKEQVLVHCQSKEQVLVHRQSKEQVLVHRQSKEQVLVHHQSKERVHQSQTVCFIEVRNCYCFFTINLSTMLSCVADSINGRFSPCCIVVTGEICCVFDSKVCFISRRFTFCYCFTTDDLSKCWILCCFH